MTNASKMLADALQSPEKYLAS